MENVKRLFDIPYFQLKSYPKDDCLVNKINGMWEPTSTEDYINQFNALSRGLIKLGVQPGDKIGLISNNRTEWNITDMAIQQVGAIGVPIYPTISKEDYEYIFNNAELSYCFVSDEELYQKVKAVQPRVLSLKEIYTYENVKDASHWSSLKLEPEKALDDEIDKRKSAIQPGDMVTMIYTSGTTGKPKGVMLSHNNLLSNAKASKTRLPVSSDAKSLSFLPVCHVYERMLLYLYQLTGVSIYFAESLDTIGDNLKEVQPDVFTAVPRLLEKVFDKIIAKGEELSGIKKKLFFWAVSLGEEYDIHGKSGWYKFKLGIARKLIFSKWQEALGGNTKAVASGSAALSPRLARIFLAAGIPIMEGYGLTETSPVVSVNCEDNDGVRIGSVGRPLDGVDVKIAEDGEILVKGPNVMLGYYKLPDKTKEVLEDDGWFHTGDIGEIKDGFLRITDRKKEIFKTSGGKYIAPQVMENKFKESRFIEQIMVIGEGEKMPAALIVPAFDFVEEWCKRKGISDVDTREKLISNQKVIDRIQEEVDRYNQNFGHWEMVKRFELLPQEWSVETEELTPTLKLKRRVIRDKYAEQYEKIYEHKPGA